MTDWRDVADEQTLSDGKHVAADVDGVQVAVFKIAGEYYAIEDVCSHDGGEIAAGELDGDEIICPRHGARFCVKTGQVKSPPAYEDLNIFPVRVANGKIQVAVND
ncbi:MAG: non-heme iron oxygenase ferredoxin subunit [Methylomonas sp.]|jgi:3-phenylpropionate/trans-cinnamate dioxygenase ferredoxin subunit